MLSRLPPETSFLTLHSEAGRKNALPRRVRDEIVK